MVIRDRIIWVLVVTKDIRVIRVIRIIRAAKDFPPTEFSSEQLRLSQKVPHPDSSASSNTAKKPDIPRPLSPLPHTNYTHYPQRS